MRIISIEDFMKVVDYKINEISKFESALFGKSAFSYHCWDTNNDQYSISIIADISTCTVFKMSAIDYSKNTGYKWVHPDYLEQYSSQANKTQDGKIIDEFLLDDIKCIDIEVPEDILEKATAIFNRREYDDTVTIPLDFNDRDLLWLMKQAHLRDITFNQYMKMILETAAKDADSQAKIQGLS